MVTIPPSLIILGCSRRKKGSSHLVRAIDRYDGPLFRVVRKHNRRESNVSTCVLSARFGLIRGDHLVPPYDYQLQDDDYLKLRPLVDRQLKEIIHEFKPQRLFVSLGRRYWPLIEGALYREVTAEELTIASGGIGGRASQLNHWLRLCEEDCRNEAIDQLSHEVTLLGTTIRMSKSEVLHRAKEALSVDPKGALRFQTWCVDVGNERVAPKWLVSILFDKPVSCFRSGEARRILSLFGVKCSINNQRIRS